MESSPSRTIAGIEKNGELILAMAIAFPPFSRRITLKSSLPVRKIKVLLADDHALLRQGLAHAVAREADMCVVGEAASGTDAIRQFHALAPDITVMDLSMPEMSGLQAMEQIRAVAPHAQVIILTTYKGDANIARALNAGAAGFILKTATPVEFTNAIRAVHGGERSITPEAADELVNHLHLALLSEREIAVLNCIASGRSNKRIAVALSLGEETVKSHVRNILAKLHANDRTHAVTIGLRRGFIASESVRR